MGERGLLLLGCVQAVDVADLAAVLLRFLLKLGLLGKVIGFSVLALQIGQIQNFDPAQSQELLKSLTAGLGIALLTTMVGLVGNVLLGLQLTRLDRFADALVAQAQRHGLSVQARQD